MRRTLLLCFIHGFKGDANTFGPGSRFAQELRQRVAQALPRVDVRVAVYPPYETRGDLAATVNHLVEWLLDRVIDFEVAARTPSPTVDPSVHCVLIGHSMGGIVAADALLSLVGDRRISHEGDKEAEHSDHKDTKDAKESKETETPAAIQPELNSLMFPYIQGVLGFDTPYLGIAPGVVAHGAQDRYTSTSAALSQLGSLGEAIWGGGAAGGAAAASAATASRKAAGALPAPPPPQSSKTDKHTSSWGWGKIALVAGASALASGAAAAVAYRNREQLTEGWAWAASHLEFVGCLARGEDLRRRIARVEHAHQQLGVGFGNLYTRLGQKAAARKTSSSPAAALLPADRTFCNLPSREPAGMFTPADNPNYNVLLSDARDMIARWTETTDWYKASSSKKSTFP